MNIEPRRLVDDAGASELGDALREARAAVGDKARIDGLWQRLGDSAATGMGAAATTTAVSGISGVKVLLGLGVLVLGVVGTAHFASSHLVLGRTHARPAVSAPVVAAPSPVVEAVAVVEAQRALPEPTASVQRQPRRKQSVTVMSPAAGAVSDPDAEVSLLTRAEQALVLSPARALPILQEHAQRFPEGVLAQEREVLRIDAELALGRKAQAVERIRQFLLAFPRSAHRHRFEQTLATAILPSGDHKREAQRTPTE